MCKGNVQLKHLYFSMAGSENKIFIEVMCFFQNSHNSKNILLYNHNTIIIHKKLHMDIKYYLYRVHIQISPIVLKNLRILESIKFSHVTFGCHISLVSYFEFVHWFPTSQILWRRLLHRQHCVLPIVCHEEIHKIILSHY